MGPVRRSKKPSPDGWEMIEPTIDDLNKKMREAETDPHEGKRKVEAEWPIFRIHHKRSRYIYDLYYKRKVISKVGALLFFLIICIGIIQLLHQGEDCRCKFDS